MRRWPALALLVVLAACHGESSTNQAIPAATPVANLSDARRVPAPSSGIGSAALPAPELDGVTTAAGSWRFQVSADGDQAVFGDAGQPSEFAMRCDAQARRMIFTRASGDGGKTMQIVAGDGAATFYTEPGTAGRIQASDPAMDTFLTDTLAGAKGRIGVKIGSGSTFAMPVDPAIARTIKRCAAPRM